MQPLRNPGPELEIKLLNSNLTFPKILSAAISSLWLISWFLCTNSHSVPETNIWPETWYFKIKTNQLKMASIIIISLPLNSFHSVYMNSNSWPHNRYPDSDPGHVDNIPYVLSLLFTKCFRNVYEKCSKFILLLKKLSALQRSFSEEGLKSENVQTANGAKNFFDRFVCSQYYNQISIFKGPLFSKPPLTNIFLCINYKILRILKV